MSKSMLVRIIVIAALLGAMAISPLGKRLYMTLRPADQMLAGWQDYRATSFENALRGGGPVLVEVYASWCPTCMAQHKALAALKANGATPPIPAFRVNYDRDKDFLSQHDVEHTGTLILFRDGKEVSRALGLVKAETIEGFLRQNGVLSGQEKSSARWAKLRAL